MPHSALDVIKHSFLGGTCRQLVLSQCRPGAAVEFSKVVVRPVTIRERDQWQFTYHHPRKVTHENCDARQAAALVTKLLHESFEQVALYTTEADYAIRARRDGSFAISAAAPTKAEKGAAHDRSKAYLIPEGTPCPFLAEIGVMTATGQVRKAMFHKFRQINRFLELVQDIVPSLPEGGELHVVDFGCGKSYLTFALHHLLTVIHARRVEIVGLDRQAEVIRTCSQLAGRLGCEGLSFREGDIAGFTPAGPVDLAVSLHACDTATDAALAQAVRWNCPVILAVPCCQHELAPAIRNELFAPLARHGLLHERFAALATDALRAALLEIHGYATQVVEFIDMEHTPKNVLIRAVRRSSMDESLCASRRAEYQQFRDALGLQTCFLEQALGTGSEPK
ncbi:MAG: SAM-dependent methyltransferase [Planctomycetaceae bacterium]|nr:SAM-dependent methyltransferase [Planctomycetaceae bacterium]